MTPGDSEITVERLQEIIELTLELEEEIPEEIGIVVQELVEEVVRLQRDKKVGSLTELWERDRLPPWLIRLRRPKNVHHPEDSRPEGS